MLFSSNPRKSISTILSVNSNLKGQYLKNVKEREKQFERQNIDYVIECDFDEIKNVSAIGVDDISKKYIISLDLKKYSFKYLIKKVGKKSRKNK